MPDKKVNQSAAAAIPTSKVYLALFSQSGTDAPVATEIQNTLEQNVTWIRERPGDYYGVFDTPIPIDKLILLNGTDFAGDNTIFLPVGDFKSINGYLIISLQIINGAATNISVSTLDISLKPVEYSALMTITRIPIKMEIYD